MEKAKVEVTVVKTDKGNIRINFEDAGSCMIPDERCNIFLIGAFEIELQNALKQKNLNHQVNDTTVG